jgi:hypothetical protein
MLSVPRTIGLSLLLVSTAWLVVSGCGAARVEEGDARPAVVATVFAAPPALAPAPPADGSRVTAANEPDEPVATALEGTWSEDFESRYGCQDQIDIRQSPAGLRLSGVDCNDGEPYDFRETSFDGRALNVRVIVPSTKYVLRYRLELHERDELEGDVDVDAPGGGGSTTYKVKWVRQSEP